MEPFSSSEPSLVLTGALCCPSAPQGGREGSCWLLHQPLLKLSWGSYRKGEKDRPMPLLCPSRKQRERNNYRSKNWDVAHVRFLTVSHMPVLSQAQSVWFLVRLDRFSISLKLEKRRLTYSRQSQYMQNLPHCKTVSSKRNKPFILIIYLEVITKSSVSHFSIC